MSIGRSRVVLGRRGQCQHEYLVLLALVLGGCLCVIHWLTPGNVVDPWSWEGVRAAFQSILSILAVLLGLPLFMMLAALTMDTVGRIRRTQTERHLATLRRLQRAGMQASERDLRTALRFTRHRQADVRQQAVETALFLTHACASLGKSLVSHRPAIERALRSELGFVQALADQGPQTPLIALVTLGAKLGAGTEAKAIAQATSDPAELARWICSQESVRRSSEIQVSVGYDTGPIPSQTERARFLALFLYVASTDLRRFQALTPRPQRDANAAYGLLIRGDRIEPKFRGQVRGKRLDYVFSLPRLMTPASWAEFLREVQLLNLGLLLASAEDSYRGFFQPEAPAWLDSRLRAIAGAYRTFERRLVTLLRQYDEFRDSRLIHPLDRCDHRERVAALRAYRLEECLYPQHPWVVPLYGIDGSWDRLLPVLRAVEGMLLHQGEVAGGTVTRGWQFIRDVRLTGYRSAMEIRELLDESHPAAPAAVHLDPFIDPQNEPATRYYLQAVHQALAEGDVSLNQLLDPRTFLQASSYYLGKHSDVAA